MRIGKPESKEKGFVRFGDIGIGNELPVKLEELNNAIQGYFESNVHVYEQFSEKESFENLKNYFLKPLDKT